MCVLQVTVQQMPVYVLATVTFVLVLAQHIAAQQVLIYVLVTVISVLVQVQHITVQQMWRYVLEIVISVLVQVQHITDQQMWRYVLVTVISVLVQVQHIAAQQVMLFVLIQPPLVIVPEVALALIVRHVQFVIIMAAAVVPLAVPGGIAVAMVWPAGMAQIATVRHTHAALSLTGPAIINRTNSVTAPLINAAMCYTLHLSRNNVLIETFIV